MSEVTTGVGGKISGLLALTCETDAPSLPVGAPVQVSGDYKVELADGSAIVLGHVDVANVKRVGGAYPVFVNPGIVTVEARGFAVRKGLAGGTITAGDGVKYDVGGHLVTGATPDDAGFVGVALTGASLGGYLDFLVM